MMQISSILSRIFFAFLLFQTTFGNLAFATTAGEPCGFTTTCDKGTVCVGSTDTNNDGQCVMMPIAVSMCTVLNWIQEYSTYFMIFAVVALGFAFFLGKISWGMIISVILGIAVIKGAIVITQKTTGVSKNYCSASSMQSSKACTNPRWNINSAQSRFGVKTKYNTEATPLCPKPMQCIEQDCKAYKAWGVRDDNTTGESPTLDAINEQRKKNGYDSVGSLSGGLILRSDYANISQSSVDISKIYITQTSTSHFVPAELAEIPSSVLPESFKLYLKCTPTSIDVRTNFLVCTHSCTGNDKVIEDTKATTCAAAGLTEV